ncbi:MAG: 8-amino-7-oxononanoate synthase [Nitrospirota bacterium]|nr:8-amino-7-oxononanoate synthase [Nitrospirota bacterium]MDP2382339.1 8-amino-7-oxononanoate synthase [Nitrospirota bacterium]MDP3596521.1 8-amino-7-oxononanoate synthase [Nitrospirota bacterium]
MFNKQLDELAARHLTRRLTPLHSGVGPVVEMAGRQMLLFASNDYLGLAMHPEVIQAAVEATQRFGAGSGAARLVSGSLPPHQELDTALAQFKGTEAALTYGSGYLANIGTIPALIGRGGLILADRLCHASLIDGCRLSAADFRIYRHNDTDHLQSLLAARRQPRRTLIVTDGLFSMDGDLAPLPELNRLAQEYEADLYIDDAHGTGVMGPHGRGSVEHFGLDTQIPFQMGTLGKAFGSSGAYIAGPSTLIQYLMNTSRSFIFTTAPPPSSAAAVTAALRIIQREPERRARLWTNRERLFTGLTQMGFTLSPSVSPIIPILVGSAETALSFAEHLFAEGLYAPAIRPPTVPDATSRIRVTVTSEHHSSHIDQALAAFQRAGQSAGLI